MSDERKIYNIELLNDKVRLTQSLTLTSYKLEERLRTFQYMGSKRSIDEAVEKAKLPPFAIPFYTYVFKYNDIPSQDTLFEDYLERNFTFFVDEKVITEIDGKECIFEMESIKSRILRTYPSLIRDLHFFLILRESDIVDDVFYSFIDDYYNSIDLTVWKNKKKYSIALRINTKRSLHYMGKKLFRHKTTPNNLIELNLSMDNKTKKVGDFFLYSERELNILKAKFDEV